jgi:hypothetical protein
MKFTGIGLYKQLDDGSTILIPGLYPYENETYSLMVDGAVYPATGGPEMPVTNSSKIEMVLYPPLPFSNEITSSLNVNFSFSYTYGHNWTAHQYLSGIHQYDYNPANVVQPELADGVMEVAIW